MGPRDHPFTQPVKPSRSWLNLLLSNIYLYICSYYLFIYNKLFRKKKIIIIIIISDVIMRSIQNCWTTI